jgi:preprotein translocase subunit SecF
MRIIRDFIYNISDVVVVLLIIAVSGFIIWDKADVLMNVGANTQFSEGTEVSEAQEQNTQNIETQTDKIPESSIKEEMNTSPAETKAAVTKKEDTKKENTKKAATTKGGSFTVKEHWTSYEVAKSLADKGYIKDELKFDQKMISKKADTRVHPGTFKIPAGSTDDQIIKILTGV